MKIEKNTIRGWLLENKYEDVLQLIDSVIGKWKTLGKKTRRNWWDVLAGDEADGSPITIERVTFPVLRAARLRKGLKVTSNCICRNKKEVILPVKLNRWNSNEQ